MIESKKTMFNFKGSKFKEPQEDKKPFGQRPPKGQFGKKKYNWQNKPKIKKLKRGEVVDQDYLNWLRSKPCIITNMTGPKGTGPNNIHIHHINSRTLGRNDHLTVPLMGFVHSWGEWSYHSCDRSKFCVKWSIDGDIKEFFTKKASELREEYLKEK